MEIRYIHAALPDLQFMGDPDSFEVFFPSVADRESPDRTVHPLRLSPHHCMNSALWRQQKQDDEPSKAALCR